MDRFGLRVADGVALARLNAAGASPVSRLSSRADIHCCHRRWRTAAEADVRGQPLTRQSKGAPQAEIGLAIELAKRVSQPKGWMLRVVP